MPQERLLWIDAREFDWLRYWKARGRPAIVLDDLEDDGDHDPALVYGCFLLNRLGERWPGIQTVMDRLKGERLVYLCPTERGPQWRRMQLLDIEFVARSTSGQRWAMAAWAQVAATAMFKIIEKQPGNRNARAGRSAILQIAVNASLAIPRGPSPLFCGIRGGTSSVI
jgi:hypothetical protein